jgi:hypothetical protein
MRKLYSAAAVSATWRSVEGQRISKGELTKIELWRSGVTENEQHEGMPLDGPSEHLGHPRWIGGNKVQCSPYGDMMLLTTCCWDVDKVVIFESIARRQTKIFGTNVESDLTTHNSQEMQFCCRSSKNRTGSQYMKVMKGLSRLSNGYSCATIESKIYELWSLKVVVGC